MNKKGSLQDIGYMVILIFTLTILFLAFSAGWGPAMQIAKNTTAFNASSQATAALNSSIELQSRFDGVIFTTLIAFFLAIMIISWFVPTYSIFAFIYLIGLIIFIALALTFSFIWDSLIKTVPALATALTYLPITDNILEHFGLITTVIGFIAMIVMFSKPSQGY